MTIEAEFEKQVSSKKLSDAKVVTLVKSYHKRIEESDFTQNTRFTKMSRINMIVKRLYPHLYTEVLRFNVPEKSEKKSAIEERNEFNMNRLENRQEFTFNEIMNAIKTLKDSDNYYELVVCILLATGRRSVEVIARGNFEPSELAHHILFSGQTKTGDEKRDAYDIPVIGITPQILIRLVKKIRNMKNYIDKSNMFISSRTNGYLNKEIVNVLDKPERHVTSETIRCIYAFIAYRLYGNPRISEPVYCSKILGHKGTPHVFVDNYNRVFVSGIKSNLELEVPEEKETIEILREEIDKRDKEIASLKAQIKRLKN